MSSTKLKESSQAGQVKLLPPGSTIKVNGTIEQAAIQINGFTLMAPVFVPDLDEVRAFAEELHEKGEPWQGKAFGWHGHYEPANDDVPPGSKATINPASFTLGDATAWCYTRTWEDDEPAEFVTHSLIPDPDTLFAHAFG